MALVDVDTDVQQTNLTLTSVVFEFSIICEQNKKINRFNFNKCCI